jgi:hypothetical protein
MPADKVIWTISCDEIGFAQAVQAHSHAEMVGALVERGFQRILKPEVPFQSEPLGYIDAAGRTWDAMPTVVPWVQGMKHIRDVAENTQPHDTEGATPCCTSTP